MLAQILHDLHVPKELLDELPEDQKQLLFCKMREEQVRRYHQREEEEQIHGNISIDRRKGQKKKQVNFRLGADGNEWCWVMGESPDITDEQFNNNRMDNENMEFDYQNEQKQLKNTPNPSTQPVKSGVFYTVHRDERKQIEEISSNIQEARRIFELLESETRRLALSKENEIINKPQHPPLQVSQSDFVDEIFYHKIEERAKKADQERREAARRARDNYHHQLNVCFDTDNQTIFTLQPMPLNRTTPIEKKTPIPAFPSPSSDIIEQQQSKHLSPITRANIRQWFCTNEIPYGAFRSSNGKIYPWFHGIISRAYTEQILSLKPVGSYLIRVSEKIFGYVLSYRASDHCRHLLIEVIQPEHSYRFLGGAKQESFGNLSQLIEKYTTTPIRSNSTDVLSYPCEQLDLERADYADLFVENDKLYESLYISLDTTTSSIKSTTHM